MNKNCRLDITSGLTPVNFEVFCTYVFDILPIRTKTLESYRSAYRCHIQGHFADRGLGEISKSDVLTLISSLTPQTRAKVLAILKTIFREAAQLELIESVPTAGIRNPIPIVAARKFLTWDEIKNADFGAYVTQIQFLALHGLRWGEAVVLTESDIRDGRVYVRRSIHGATKTRAGNRVVPFIGDFEPFPKSPKTLRKVLEPHGVHIHSLRHTYAHILKSQGIHVTTAQKLMGHSSPNTTMSVYTRVLDREIDESGIVLRKLLS